MDVSTALFCCEGQFRVEGGGRILNICILLQDPLTDLEQIWCCDKEYPCGCPNSVILLRGAVKGEEGRYYIFAHYLKTSCPIWAKFDVVTKSTQADVLTKLFFFERGIFRGRRVDFLYLRFTPRSLHRFGPNLVW